MVDLNDWIVPKVKWLSQLTKRWTVSNNFFWKGTRSKPFWSKKWM